MKAKRLLALLLAIVMVAGMLPMSTSAAGPNGETIKLELKSTPNFGSMTLAVMGGGSYQQHDDTFDSYEKYGTITGIPGASTYMIMEPSQVDKTPAALEEYQKIAGDAKAKSEVNLGEYVYVTLKMSGDNLPNGIFPSQIVVRYDPEVFDAPGAGTNTYAKPMVNLLQQTVTNSAPTTQHTINGKTFGYNMTMNNTSAVYERHPLTNQTDSALENKEVMVMQPYFDGGLTKVMGTLPDWDIIIPFKAKKAATDSEIVPMVSFASGLTGGNNGQLEFYSPKNAIAPTNTTVFTTDDCTKYEGTKEDADHPVYEVKGTTITVTNNSAGPSSDNYDANSVINNKNLPYLADADASDLNDNNDYLTFPADETNFVVGDTVIFYAEGTDENTFGTELGRTVITADKLFTLTGNGSDAAAVSPAPNDGDSVAGMSLKLIDENADASQQTDGWSYLKGESKVWIARKAAPQAGAAEEDQPGVSLPKSSKLIDIHPEQPVYYIADGGTPVKDGVPGSSSDNPYTVYVGTKVADVMDGLVSSGALKTNYGTNVQARVESSIDATVTTNLAANWNSSKLYDGTAIDGLTSGLVQPGTGPSKDPAETGEYVYTKLGHYEIRNPYMPLEQDGVTIADQPTDTTDTTNYAIPAGGFGEVIYVNVVPNPADYLMVSAGEDSNPTSVKTLTILGKTCTYLENGDIINIYDAATDTTLLGTATVSGKADDAATVDLEFDPTDSTSNPNGSVWWAGTAIPASVKVEHQYGAVPNDVRSDKAVIGIKNDDGTAVVAGSVDLNQTMFNNYFCEISRDTTFEELWKQITPVDYSIVGRPAGGGATQTTDLQLTYDQTYFATEGAQPEWMKMGFKFETATLTDGTVGAFTDVTGTTEHPDPIDAFNAEAGTYNKTTGTGGHTLNTVYRITYNIPTSADLGTSYTGTTPYTNDIPCTVTVQAVVSNLIRLEGTDDRPLQIHVTENKPLGEVDTVVISNDVRGELYTALQQTGANLKIILTDPANGDREVGATSATTDITAVTEGSGAGLTYKYTVQVSQTARHTGGTLDLHIVSLGADGSSNKAASFVVDKAEEFVAFAVLAPTPTQVDIYNGDLDTTLADELTQVIDYMNKATTVNGPVLQYGYNKANPTEGSTDYVPDMDTAQTQALLAAPYGDVTKWSATGTTDANGYKEIALDLSAAVTAADWDAKTDAATSLKINVPESVRNGSDPKQSYKLDDTKYDDNQDPKASEVLADGNLIVENNPYPQADVIAIQDGNDAKYNGLIIDVYATKGGTPMQVGTATLTGDGTRKDITLMNTFTGLDSMGGQLSFTVRKTGIAPSDPATKNYGVEKYVLWETTTVTPTSKQMRYTDVLTTPTDDTSAVELDKVKANLPKTVSASAVHLQDDDDNPGKYIPKTGETVTLTPNVNKWYEDGTEIAVSSFQLTQQPAAGAANFEHNKLVADYDPATVSGTGHEVRVTGNNGVSDVEVLTPTAAAAIVTPPTDYLKSNEFDLILTNDADSAAQTPFPDHINVIFNGDSSKENDDDSTNDSIKIDISAATNMGDLSNVVAIITYPDADGTTKTLQTTDPIGADGIIEIPYNTVGKDGVTFTGLSLSGGNATISFLDTSGTPTPVESTSQAYPFKAQASALTITKNAPIGILSLTVDTIKSNAELLELALSYKTADVTLNDDPGTTQNIPLKLDGSGAAIDTVASDWVLQVNTTTDNSEDANWSPVNTTGSTTAYAHALSTIQPNAHYRLAIELPAEYTVPDSAATRAGKKIVNDPANKKVAFITVSLYTDDTNPLQLTDGNNDLYLHGAEGDSLAHAELLRRGEIDAGDNEAQIKAKVAKYRTDTTFYYNYESYEHQTGDVEKFYPYVSFYAADENKKANIQSVLTADGTSHNADGDLTTWLDDPKTVITVESWDVTDGTKKPVAIQSKNADGSDGPVLDYIEPKHSPRAEDYFVFDTEVKRFIENYVIKYTVKKGDETFVAERKVKLRYRSGDMNADASKTRADIERINLTIAGGEVLKAPDKGSMTDEEYAALGQKYVDESNYIVDVNGDGSKTRADVELFNLIIAGEEYSAKRW